MIGRTESDCIERIGAEAAHGAADVPADSWAVLKLTIGTVRYASVPEHFDGICLPCSGDIDAELGLCREIGHMHIIAMLSRCLSRTALRSHGLWILDISCAHNAPRPMHFQRLTKNAQPLTRKSIVACVILASIEESAPIRHWHKHFGASACQQLLNRRQKSTVIPLHRKWVRMQIDLSGSHSKVVRESSDIWLACNAPIAHTRTSV